ncbi:MAG: hypothetical protein NTX03_11570 [Bacteroidetes bacterium]|nr:hypothetical protein [Bacteroidota bacterium]
MQKGIIAFFFSLLIFTAAQSQFYIGAGWHASIARNGMGNAYTYAYKFNHETGYNMVKEMHFTNFFNGPKVEMGITSSGELSFNMHLGWYNKHAYMSGSRTDIASKTQEDRDIKIRFNAIQMGFRMEAYKGLWLGVNYDMGEFEVLSKSNIGKDAGSYVDAYSSGSRLFGLYMASGCTLDAQYILDKRAAIGLDYHFNVTDINLGPPPVEFRYATSNIGINLLVFLYYQKKKGLYD